MKKSLEFFMTKDDEAALSDALTALIPAVRFINDCYWPSPKPPLRQSIQDCESKAIYLWDPGVSSELPCIRHSDGIRFHGPQSGPVIQYLRGIQDDDILRVGTISAGCSDTDSAIIAFTTTVWRALRNICVPGLVAVSPTGEILSRKVPRFVLGRHAREWALSNDARFFRDRTVMNRYRPETS